MATILFQKYGIIPDEDNTNVFTFVFENPQKLLELKSVESSEVTFGGHRWTVVCMRKEEKYVGVYLKWKYHDGQSASSVSCKTSYSLSIVHRNEPNDSKLFSSNQKFSSSQSLLGKSKMIALSDLLEVGGGFLDETGKRIILELTMKRCTSRYEKTIDVSVKARTKKNVSGYYFDTSTFLLANYRWFLRVYTAKANANGLPAVYLYLFSKAKGLSMECSFRLYLGDDMTETLVYNFGEGAKFDGFGKTLSEPLYNVEKLNEVTAGVELDTLTIYKDMLLSLRPQNVYAPQLYKDYNSHGSGSAYEANSKGNSPYGGLTPSEAFQDHEGNFWKADIVRDSRRLTIVFDKAVHHYQQNRTKLLCWTAQLLSRDMEKAPDIPMNGAPIIGYFSNYIDERGYKMGFPMDVAELEESRSAYTGPDSEVLVRIDIHTLQTIPVAMKSIPRFDYHARHLLVNRTSAHHESSNMESLKDMSASRGSLSFLDSRDDRLTSDSSTSSGKFALYKSYDSLDAMTTSDFVSGLDDDLGKSFFSQLLKQVAAINNNNNNHHSNRHGDKLDGFLTHRETFLGAREDVSTESGIAISEDTALFQDARTSPVDVAKQKELVGIFTKFFQQRLPFRVGEVVEVGSLGTGTCTRSRSDVDLVIFSPDLPRDGWHAWVKPLLQALRSLIQHTVTSSDPFHPLPDCSTFSITDSSLQFICGGLDVDIMCTFDWDSDDGGGYQPLYQATCATESKVKRTWHALACARLQKKFLNDQANEVKEVIKVVKHWRNTVQWRKVSYRPNSYLLALLVIRAVQDTKSNEIKTVLQRFGSYVLAPELSLSWNTFYQADKYPVEFEPPTPLVRNPANPGHNVADTLSYWGQFRAETATWVRGLGITLTDTNSYTPDSPKH